MRRAMWGVCLLAALPAMADEFFPGEGWTKTPNPLASPDATVGGGIVAFAGQYPKSLNYYLDNNTLSAQVFGQMYETLLDMDPISAEYTPGLARRWSISTDRKVFTFWIDERARWSDGRPVTPQDVKWTFDTVMAHPLTGSHKVSLGVFQSPEIVGSNAVRFVASQVHWRNLGAAGGFHILPRHAFESRDFGKVNFEFPVVSGLYRLGEVKESQHVRLERRADWWQAEDPRYRHVGNFQTITFRFFAEQENAYEEFKKGGIDIFPVYMARIWVNETRGEKFDRNWIVKQKVRNYNPVGFQGFAMNRRRPPFDDVRVRRALAHLLDRDKMNRTLMYGQYFLHRSYFEDLYDRNTPCTNAPVAFDKDAARRLLQEAGWTANRKSGLLEKDGKPLAFTFLTRDQSSDKFLAVYNEDLKDAGVQMRIERKDNAAWFKDMDEFNYDMTWASWSAGLYKDPEDMWSSKEATRPSGNNITGFQDPAVDALIEKQKTLFNVAERHAICRQIDALVTAQCPYALLWNINYSRLLYWNKFGTPPTVLSKFGDHDAAFAYWWYDEDSAADLKAAVDGGSFLPPRPAEVIFDDAFKRPE